MRTASWLLLLCAGGGSLLTATAQKPPLANFKCTVGDCQSGKGAQEHSSGFKYEGDFVDGVRTGLGVETMPGGVRYAGTFSDNLPNGLGVMQFPDGSFLAGLTFVAFRVLALGIFSCCFNKALAA